MTLTLDNKTNIIFDFLRPKNVGKHTLFVVVSCLDFKKADDKSRLSGRFVPLHKVLCTIAMNVIHQNEGNASGF